MAGKFALALQATPGAEVALVASRSRARAETLVRALGVGKAVEGYEAAAACDVDIFYIATPPTEHLANALVCFAAGKPVLIEKPFASTLAEAQAIVEAAGAAGLFCMEGMWTRFMPALALARRALADGVIGEPRSLSASFAAPETVDPHASLFDRKLGGGALAHRGVYPVSLAVDLLGPAQVAGVASIVGATGVDEDVAAILRHSTGAASSIRASARTTGANELIVYGTEGVLRLRGPIFRPHAVEITRSSPRGGAGASWSRAAKLKDSALAHALRQAADGLAPALRRKARVLRAPYRGNGYRHEIEAVMSCLSAGQLEHPLMTHADTLATARLIDEIRAGVGGEARAARSPT
jgi:predicted dehydrogenase